MLDDKMRSSRKINTKLIEKITVKLSDNESGIHDHAIELCRKHRELEWKIIEVLQKIDRMKLYKKLGGTSLFDYSVRILKLSEPVAYSLIRVARKSLEIPELGASVKAGTLSANKAARLVAALNRENAGDLISFAATHSARETDFEVARLNPSKVVQARAKPIGEDLVEIKVVVSRSVHEKLVRAQNIAAQRAGKHVGLPETLEQIVDDFLGRRDPVKKAERALQREASRQAKHTASETAKLCTYRVGADKSAKSESNHSVARSSAREMEAEPKAAQTPSMRTPLTAAEKHAVFARDQGRCTHLHADGTRCENERWLQVHHIRPVGHGGGNEPDNLTTLCSAHHDLVHQLTLPIEGQITWLRSPSLLYARTDKPRFI